MFSKSLSGSDHMLTCDLHESHFFWGIGSNEWSISIVITSIWLQNKAEQEKFIKVSEAYETLKDPDKRQKYDLYGSYPSYTRKYDYRSQTEYDNLFYNGLYHDDPYVDTVTGRNFCEYFYY